jgi:2-keto-4-pentenoate hydratase/2-oxohepta-3-ene-1,7-dioic acid hydratase in catechol pathway
VKIVRFNSGEEAGCGILEGDTVKVIKDDFYKEIVLSGVEYDLDQVKLLAPVEPEKIIAVGLNYMSHAKEMDMEIPSDPLFFLKPVSSILNPFEKIVRPWQSGQVEYEAELAVVIKKQGKNIPEDQVPDYVMGYTCLNDVTARDLQFKESQWARSKGFDTFCPIGPWIETEYNYRGKQIRAILSGVVKQDANTDDFINSVESLVSYISTIMTLKPGDIIATGTAGGIGPMVNGDTIKIEIEGIGTLENPVVDGVKPA